MHTRKQTIPKKYLTSILSSQGIGMSLNMNRKFLSQMNTKPYLEKMK